MINIGFQNKTALITGGSRGIGFSLVKLFTQCGANVIATTATEKSLDKLNKIHPNVIFVI